MIQYIDRRLAKQNARTLLRSARVSPLLFTLLYFAVVTALDLMDCFSGEGLFSTFMYVFINLMVWLLAAGYTLYCMEIRRGEVGEFATLFDGFSFAGKVILLNLLTYLLIALWSILFIIPGVIASYRYRFALFNLYEDPDRGVIECLELSKQQTYGYKAQLFMLDVSYLGWGILARLAFFLLNVQYYADTWSSVAPAFGSDAHTMAAFFTMPALSLLGETLLIDIWMAVVALFYFPHYRCCELEYFEIAKASLRHAPAGDGFGGFGGF